MLSIIIPTYNEKENIRPLVRSVFQNAPQDAELIIVDDNSPDGTATEVSKLKTEYGRLVLISREGKLGLTSAVLCGFQASKGSHILVMDADLSHPPEKIPDFVSKLGQSDLVVGSRLAKGGGVEKWPLERRIISFAAEMLARSAISTRCTDPLSGFFAVEREIMQRTRFRTKGYKLLLNILADNPRIKIAEIPYFFRDRLSGKTKLGLGEMATYIADLKRIRFG